MVVTLKYLFGMYFGHRKIGTGTNSTMPRPWIHNCEFTLDLNVSQPGKNHYTLGCSFWLA